MDSLVMIKNRFLPLLFVLCAPVLASCSTITEGSTQQISFKTVGADDANCDVQLGVNDYRYNVMPPQTIWVQKARKPIFVTCVAPGNRVATVTVESEVAGTTAFNLLNAGLGVAVDGESGALYKYPDEIVIDFMGVVAKNQPLPSYHNVGALDPSEQGIEYMGPDTPALTQDKIVADRYKKAYEEAAVLEAEEAAMEIEKQRRIDSVEGGFQGDKGGKDKNAVQVAPLSEVAPQPSKVTIAKSATEELSFEPAPKLGKPLFPSSTSF
jgi:predicted small secreted protein